MSSARCSATSILCRTSAAATGRLSARWPGAWALAGVGFDARQVLTHELADIAEHYHLLALITPSAADNLGLVATHLDKQLDTLGTSEWNRVLTAITTAPNRLRHAHGGRDEAPDGPDFAGDPEDAVRRLARRRSTWQPAADRQPADGRAVAVQRPTLRIRDGGSPVWLTASISSSRS